MGRKLTREFKEDYCWNCKHADRKAIKKGRDHCSSEYEPRGGQCTSFRER